MQLDNLGACLPPHLSFLLPRGDYISRLGYYSTTVAETSSFKPFNTLKASCRSHKRKRPTDLTMRTIKLYSSSTGDNSPCLSLSLFTLRVQEGNTTVVRRRHRVSRNSPTIRTLLFFLRVNMAVQCYTLG